MTNQEMLLVLRGGRDGKIRLFDEFMNRVQQGEPLTDDELPIFETLKKELFKPASEVVEMAASLKGQAKVNS